MRIVLPRHLTSGLLPVIVLLLPLLPLHARKAPSEAGRPVVMLRLSMQNTSVDSLRARTLAQLRQYPNCCDEVWFSTGANLPLMEAHRDHVGHLRRVKEELSRLGIVTSLQVQMTIGHGDQTDPTDGWEGKHWTGWTGSTGVEARHCSCPRQTAFLDYMRTMARTYAALKPQSVWIDDDLRYDNHLPATRGSLIGCWCETCVGEFSHEEGQAWTRTTLADAVRADAALAARWQAFTIESLRRIAAIIAEEVHDVSPTTRMGYQKTLHAADTAIVKAVLKTLATVSGQKVGYRPGNMSYYDRYQPKEQIVKSMDAARFVDILNAADYVDVFCPEVESWPRHYGSRTAQSALLEGFSALAYGLDAVSLFVVDRGEEDADTQNSSMFAPLNDGAPTLRAYARANQGTSAVGFRAAADNATLFDFATFGIPVLPGPGISLGTLRQEDLHAADLCTQPSSAVQALRQRLDQRAASPVVCQSPFVGLVIPRVTANGTLRTIGLLNSRIDTQGPIRLQLPNLPANVRHVVWHELRQKPRRLKVERPKSGPATITVPSLNAWNAGYIDLPTQQ